MAVERFIPQGIEQEPVERRAAPRAPVEELRVVELDGERLEPDALTVLDAGAESVFVSGAAAERLLCGGRCILALRLGDREVSARCEVVRREVGLRRGVALRLMPGEAQGRRLLAEALEFHAALRGG